MGMKWDGAAITKKVEAAGKRGLAQAAEMVLAKANEQTPVDTGELVRSSTVSIGPQGDLATLSYNTPYAVRQHEDLALNHKQGNAKYLERAVQDNSPAASKFIANAISDALKGGGLT